MQIKAVVKRAQMVEAALRCALLHCDPSTLAERLFERGEKTCDLKVGHPPGQAQRSSGPFGPGTPKESAKSPKACPPRGSPRVPKECATESEKSPKREGPGRPLCLARWCPTQRFRYRGPKPQKCPKWLEEGAKGVLDPGSKGLPRVLCITKTLLCTGATLFCASARGLWRPWPKRPVAPSPNHLSTFAVRAMRERCVSLKEAPLKPALILTHVTRISTEQTSMRTKWF